MSNWRTTLLGVLTIAGGAIKIAVALLGGQSPGVEDGAVVAAGIGLVAAADANKKR